MSIKKLEKGLEKYVKLMELFQKTDVKNNADFKRLYIGFYRMGRRTKDFYNVYFDYLEKNKDNKEISFIKILEHLKCKTNRVEASFASKMLHTLKPDMPILDSIVLKYIGLSLPGYYCKDRLERINSVYSQLVTWYEANQETVSDFVKIFDKRFKKKSDYPNISVSNIKKADFIIWSGLGK